MAKGFFSKRSIGLALVLAVLGFFSWRGWNWWAWATAPSTLSITASTTQQLVNLRIPPGTSAQEIGQELEMMGLIRSANAWSLWARWLMLNDPNGGFRAGTYQLSRRQSLQDIAAKIWTGDTVQLSFTIPEGWSMRQMARYFEQQQFFSAQEFFAAADRVSLAEYPWLPTNLPADSSRLEGFLYPDTYQISEPPIQPEAILKQMLNRFEQVALPLYQQRGRTTLNLAEWVTLASIVEKEAVVPQERSRIAGVFLNRLIKNIPLGADPTVEYALGIQQTPDRPLTLKDVQTDSPYNTYLHPGLPPTAIASPGKASLEAVLSPENTDYLYFVARYDGTHVFSRTLVEHQAAQSAIRDQRDASKSLDK
ncbi:MAG: endolytic transglycosylase MltG [Leptolyngbyaceae cyanobacterium RU_5_1]|nr:endolytic transglycosylase MltG [Leptolyngbyaceae cyanobacterium RU_5_1]